MSSQKSGVSISTIFVLYVVMFGATPVAAMSSDDSRLPTTSNPTVPTGHGHGQPLPKKKNIIARFVAGENAMKRRAKVDAVAAAWREKLGTKRASSFIESSGSGSTSSTGLFSSPDFGTAPKGRTLFGKTGIYKESLFDPSKHSQATETTDANNGRDSKGKTEFVPDSKETAESVPDSKETAESVPDSKEKAESDPSTEPPVAGSGSSARDSSSNNPQRGLFGCDPNQAIGTWLTDSKGKTEFVPNSENVDSDDAGQSKKNSGSSSDSTSESGKSKVVCPRTGEVVILNMPTTQYYPELK